MEWDARPMPRSRAPGQAENCRADRRVARATLRPEDSIMTNATVATQPNLNGTAEQTIDHDKLMGFVFRAVDEVGATLNTALVVMGDRLGLYRAMAGAGPLLPMEVAERSGAAERYVREWLNAQAAGGYVSYDPKSGRYTLPPEQALALTDASSP